jgi:SAM-dependent methyltransferase
MLTRAAAKGLETVEADAQRLPFDDESFDAVAMISMLHHVDDREPALAEARLREDIAAGRAPRRAGTATILSWTKP